MISYELYTSIDITQSTIFPHPATIPRPSTLRSNGITHLKIDDYPVHVSSMYKNGWKGMQSVQHYSGSAADIRIIIEQVGIETVESMELIHGNMLYDMNKFLSRLCHRGYGALKILSLDADCLGKLAFEAHDILSPVSTLRVTFREGAKVVPESN